MPTKKPAPIQEEIDRQAQDAVRIIGEAAKLAASKIAQAAGEAHKVVADAAETSVRVLHLKSADDHDLLIELRTRMEGMSKQIQSLADGTERRISDLETLKAEKRALVELADEIHGTREDRMRKVENKTSNFWIAFTIYSIAVGGMIALYIAHMWATKP
jgi:leucyl aminopeptidase (aminopeptidase T)